MPKVKKKTLEKVVKYAKLITQILERARFIIVNFEHVLHLFLVFPFLTLSVCLFDG